MKMRVLRSPTCFRGSLYFQAFRLSRLSGRDFSVENYGLKITLSSTKDALPILSMIGDNYESFEVIQGTMDDVFIEAAKEIN